MRIRTGPGQVGEPEKQVSDILAACDKFNSNLARLKALVDLLPACGIRIGDTVMISKDAFFEERT
jgi:integrase